MNLFRGLIVVGAILALPFTGYAQEAVVSGTVTDSTGGVLPGVTVTARHVATGNTFVAVTDERGAFRIGVRLGGYEVTAELQGFATMTRGGLEMLVGQQVVVSLQMEPAGLAESVTVTGEAPLIDVTSSTLGGNIDPRQMEDLPLQGRSWQDLSVLAPGVRTNESGDSPTVRNRRDFHVNLDGQQTTSILVGGGGFGTGGADQPLYSKDAIAEFQFISARFNATQGRSIGTQVNAVTKSGTNRPSGSFAGYFRHDRFKAADFVTGTVLPYQNQQLSGTLGGPIVRDKVHIFANYEFEREPQTVVYTTPYPSFNLSLPNNRKQRMGGTRMDWQLSSQTRLMARANYGLEVIPFEGGGPNHPSGATEFRRHNDEIFTTLTQVLGDRTLNELRGGFGSFYYYNYSVVRWDDHPMAASQGVTIGTPRVLFTGFTVGPAANNPQRLGQSVWSLRDDFTYSFNARGRHDVKLGGEYLYLQGYTSNCRGCQGQYTVTGVPVPANVEAIFPVWNDVSTWRMDLLSPIIQRYDVTVGTLQTYQERNTFAGWFQDDWAMTSRMTLNLGLRYDLALGQLANDIGIEPFLKAGRPNDKNNFGPRAGFAYSLNDRTVARGGYGLYFGEIVNTATSRTQSWTQLTGATVENTAPRRANFGSSPFNGPIPTYDQAQQRYCHRSNVPGCLREGLEQIIDPKAKVMYSHQASMGVQRQLGSVMAVEADYTYAGERGGFYSHRMNLTYNPVTGVNYPFSDISRRAYPLYAALGIERYARRSNNHALQTALTKRFSNRWSASGTYTLAHYADAEALPLSGIDVVTFPVAGDLGGEYSLAEGDQRHRAVFSGIWETGYGFQLSGLYFFGSGQRRYTDYGGDLRQTGINQQGGRLRPNGTVVPRNNFVGDPLHRVDVRLQRRFGLGGRAGVDGILEVFNVLNHVNYGSYVTAEGNRLYGQPNVNANVAYQPRTLQFGLRASF